MSATPITIPPLLTALIGHLAAAVPARTRTTFTELLVGAATTRGGHVTDAILAAGLSRSWTSRLEGNRLTRRRASADPRAA